jgi:heat-inducible transcriptional repressor
MAGPGGELDKRERDILRALVQDHIRTGEPVASQPLFARHDLECSPATIRAVMADLEALGFLEKPHASSGRVPTELGYRLYVETLLRVRPPPPADRERIEKLAHDASDMTTLLEGTADLLHSLSHHAGVVTTPAPSADPVRRVEFLRLRESRVLAVFVSGAGIVTNKLVQLDFAMDAGELEAAANYLNEKLRAALETAGTLPAVRERILEDMRADHASLHSLLAKVLALAEQTFAGNLAEERVIVEGESSFLDAPEFREVQKARALMRTFAEKDRILRVLDRVLRAQEVQIFIGAESEFAGLADVSVVAAPYVRGASVLGTLAVVGPTRMDYARVIPLVEATAREISRALSANSED